MLSFRRRPWKGGAAAFGPFLKIKADLRLEGARSGLCGNIAKSLCPRQRQAGSRRLRVVENVDRIDPQLKPLRLRDLEPLAHGTVQAPCSRQFESIPAETAPRPGLGTLQDDLA